MLVNLTSALNTTQTTALLPNFCREGKNKKKPGFNAMPSVPNLHILRPHRSPLQKYNEKHFTEEQTQGTQLTQFTGRGQVPIPREAPFFVSTGLALAETWRACSACPLCSRHGGSGACYGRSLSHPPRSPQNFALCR